MQQVHGVDKVIIFDWENTAFLNPFGLIESSIQQVKSIFDKLGSHDEDILSKKISDITNKMKDQTLELLQNAYAQENQGQKSIKNMVQQNISFYKNEERVVSKYMWLREFIKWYENDLTGKLKFQYMSDQLVKK